MKLIPLLDRVLVEQHQAKKLVGNLSIPKLEQKRPKTGIVIRSAEGTNFNPGDEVVFDQFTNAMAINENGKELLLISTKDIFAKIESNGN